MEIRRSLRDREECRTISCSQNIALGTTIQVKVAGKIVPMKTTSHRNRDLIEATANGKKYVACWWFGEWTARRNL
jgi:hypothetical protein